MADSVPYIILGAALGGIISGTVGIITAGYKRNRDGRDLFVTRINAMRPRLAKEDAIVFHKQTMTEIHEAVLQVNRFLSQGSKDRINRCWLDYSAIPEEDLYVHPRVVQTGDTYDLNLLAAQEEKRKMPRERLSGYLQEFVTIADKTPFLDFFN